MRTKNLTNETLKDIKSILLLSSIEQARHLKALAYYYECECYSSLPEQVKDVIEGLEVYFSASNLKSSATPNLCDRHAILLMVDLILDNHGLEVINLEPENYYDPEVIEYSNTGDSYASTVCAHKGKLFIGAWADIVETLTQQKEL